jgi:hypothetical protein
MGFVADEVVLLYPDTAASFPTLTPQTAPQSLIIIDAMA